MAELLADIKLRWYDDTALMADEPRELLETFLDSIGVTAEVACDIMEVMFLARAKDVALTTGEVKAGVLELRRRRGAKDDFGMTDRNIQIWLVYFGRIGLLDCIDNRHRFTANRKPTEAFKKTKEVIAESVRFSEKLLNKAEQAYRIK